MDDSVWQRWTWRGLAFLVIIVAIWLALPWFNPKETVPSTIGASLKSDYQFLRNRTDSVGGNWLRTLNPRMKDVQGDLIWNSTLQEGVMRFINLPAPKKNQRYLLWVHDSRAADGKPLLGAELESGSGKQELFAAISTKTPVTEPFKFVLTLNKADQTLADGQILLMVQP